MVLDSILGYRVSRIQEKDKKLALRFIKNAMVSEIAQESNYIKSLLKASFGKDYENVVHEALST